jgi:hypothetical protein
MDDPDYFDQLYIRSGRRDKYEYMSRRFGYAKDTFSTPSHDLHRLRRKALSPLFTPTKINLFHTAILSQVDKLCHRIAEYQGKKEVLPPHGSNGSISITATLILYDRSGHKLIED